MFCCKRWILLLLLAAGAWPPCATRAQGPAARPAPVEITLPAEARADGPLVRLGHLAQLNGGDTRLHAVLASLDLAEFSAERTTIAIARTQVRFRILVAGIDARAFRLVGPAQCRVKRASGAFTAAAVTRTARRLLQEHAAGIAEPLSIVPIGFVTLPSVRLGPEDKVSLRAEMLAPRVTVGQTPVDVSVVVNGEPRATVRTWFDVRAKSPQAQDDPSSDDPNNDAQPALLIRSRDHVKMIARIGAAQVMATAEALQDGRLGQLIRLRNLVSNKTVQGRVLGPGVVEVDY